jgi:hypothetical protein
MVPFVAALVNVHTPRTFSSAVCALDSVFNRVTSAWYSAMVFGAAGSDMVVCIAPPCSITPYGTSSTTRNAMMDGTNLTANLNT